MSDEAGDGIDPGKRLIRHGGAGGLSLAERLAERFHRLAWRTPLHSFRLRGRHPLKLIAVPEDPFLGDPRRGNALLEGRVTWRGESVAIADLDFAKPSWSPAFGEHLHSFAWLRDLSTVATRAQGVPVAETLMRGWLDAHADKVSAPAWDAEAWGRRILHWMAHAPLILSSTDLVYRSKVLNTLARGARHLDRTADKASLGPARVAAWCGVIAAGLLIPGGDPRRQIGEDALIRALDGAVLGDGGVAARSPLAQLDIVMLLTMLRDAYAARRMAPPAALADVLGRMVPALQGVCHADHGLSSWQGGGPVRPERIEEVIVATGVRARPLRQARDWGYQRLVQGDAVVIVDAAPPPVARLAAGGCASTLAFEMSAGPDRLIVNCGGARTAVVQIPPSLVDGLRTTAAHSTLVVGDSNSTAIHPDGTLGRGVAEVEQARHESTGGSRIEASHDGYARRFGFVHRRQLTLTADGRELRGDDMLLPAGKKRRSGATPFVIRFHLGPGVEAAPTADGMAALLRLPSGKLWQFRCRGGSLAIDESLWIDADGRPVATRQLVVSGEATAGGATIGWALKRAT
ncbi:MAG: heparinase II/III family protein [Sphingomonas sp.]|uniref:heparinase II/III family protein n=1 Tax=Sphingomonas sp. TaxID=28214 RepID=UPI001ACBC0F8|nr:heparinase II/III family protein [Sphingomonas sp.]MBN8809064.1 heparinase II/III family protein [Sphingomonas sp.]